MGSPTLMGQHGVPFDAEAADWVRRLRAESATVVCLALGDDLVGILGVADAIRPEAMAVLDRLRALGVERA